MVEAWPRREDAPVTRGNATMSAWRAAADPDDLREYDRFGPWVDQVGREIEMPRCFRDWYPELAHARFLLKVPRHLDRAQARPGMDLYRAVLAVFPDRLRLLQLEDGGVSQRELALEQVVATNTYSNLLLGRWSLLVSDGSSVDLEYNNVSRTRIAQVDRFVRSAGGSSASALSDAPAVLVSDHYFSTLLFELRSTSGESVRPIHVEGRSRPCRDERLRHRLTTGLMVLASPSELVVVNRGGPMRSRFRRADYASNVLRIPYSRMTSFAVLPAPDEPAGQFHELQVTCGSQVIRQACLARPEAVRATLLDRGIVQVEPASR